MTTINNITPKGVLDFKARPYMDDYQRIATHSAFYPGRGTALGLVYVALKGAGEAGEFVEQVGKAMRDEFLIDLQSFGELMESRKALLIAEVGDQLWYLAAKCNELGISLSEAALANLVKLSDRTARGTLRGSGDNR